MAESAGKVERPDATPIAWVALAIFSIVTLFAYVDRAIFPLLAEPVRQSLGLSDLQLGLLQGTGLALFAAAAYYPIGWLADRFDRRLVMVGGITLWSLAVAGCGFASNFQTLFLFSALVGAGEAVLAPVFYSMIPDLFRGDKRQLANSIFGITAASVGGLALGLSGMLPSIAEALRPSLPEALQSMESWRLSFFLAAAPAPIMIGLILLVPLGGARKRATPEQSRAPMAPLLPYLRAQGRTVGLFILGVSVAVFGLNAVGAWGAVILMRFFDQTAAQVGAGLGAAALIGAAGGFVISLAATRLYGRKLGLLLPLRVQWLAYLFPIVTSLIVLTAHSVALVYIVMTISGVFQTAANLLAPTSLQNLAPAPVRARFVALFFMCQMLCGAAAGPLVGALSDQLAGMERGLLVAAVSVSVSALAIAILILRACEKGFVKTVESNLAADRAALAAEAAA